VRDHDADVRRLGGEVLVVTFTEPRRVAAYLERHPLPFPVVADPSRAAYHGLGLGRTSWATFFRGGVLARYLRLLFRGWLPSSSEGEDVLQLGGDFVLDGQGRLISGYRSTEPTDRPPAADLLRALRAAAGPASGD
jgi:peroxiredoxin